jgi:hypothetical protein
MLPTLIGPELLVQDQVRLYPPATGPGSDNPM